MPCALLLIWSVTMAAAPTDPPTGPKPPLTEAQKKREYEVVEVEAYEPYIFADMY